MHPKNKSKTGLEENILNIRNNAIYIANYWVKGYSEREISEKLNVELEEVQTVIKELPKV